MYVCVYVCMYTYICPAFNLIKNIVNGVQELLNLKSIFNIV